MRRILLVFLVGLVILVGLWRIVMVQPAAPGSPLYGAQRQLTNLYASMNLSTASRTDFLLTVLEKRYEDYQHLDGTASERDALLELDTALQKAIISVNELSGAERDRTYAKLQKTGQKIINLLGDNTGGNLVTGSLEEAVMQQAQGILDSGPSVIIPPQDVVNSQTSTQVPLEVPQAVPFLINSLQNHPFVLDGAHATVACERCHSGGAYNLLPSPSKCIDCHEDPHATQMGTSCETCHNTTTWAGAVFDHTGQTDCQSCHVAATPLNHYAGQCSTCHTSTEVWTSYIFDHTGQTDCQSCHVAATPLNHYAGQCSTCHTSTTNWDIVTFNHAGFTSCSSCHIAPANHFAGECSTCHSTTTWEGATGEHDHIFPTNHGKANNNCVACHPATSTSIGDWQWTCSTCHSDASMRREHAEEGIQNIVGQCLECHATGREGGDD